MADITPESWIDYGLGRTPSPFVEGGAEMADQTALERIAEMQKWGWRDQYSKERAQDILDIAESEARRVEELEHGIRELADAWESVSGLIYSRPYQICAEQVRELLKEEK